MKYAIGLLIALCATAGAQPYRDYDRYDRNPRERFERGRHRDRLPANVKLNVDSSEYIGPVYDISRRERGFQVLTDPTRIVATGNVSRQIIRVSGHFDALMLQPTSGQPFIRGVNVRYRNGATQMIDVQRNLDRAVELDVRRGPIDYITVYGNANGSFRVLGT